MRRIPLRLNPANKLAKRKVRLYLKDPRCFYCKVPVFIYEQLDNSETPPGDEATIDHVRPKIHGKRMRLPNTPKRNVLSCKKCNERRGVLSNRLNYDNTISYNPSS